MMGYDEVMYKLEEMKGRYDDGFSCSDRDFLDLLHRMLYGKPVKDTGCSDCYRDAYVQISLRLRTEGRLPERPNYVLRTGELIHFFGTSEYYINPLEDEIAEEFLSRFPDQIGVFSEYPDDWKARVEEHRKRVCKRNHRRGKKQKGR